MLPLMRMLALHRCSVGYHDTLEHRLQVFFLQELSQEPGPRSGLYECLKALMRAWNLCLEVLDIYWRGWLGSLVHPESLRIFRGFFQTFRALKKLVMRVFNAWPYHSLIDCIILQGDTLGILVL